MLTHVLTYHIKLAFTSGLARSRVQGRVQSRLPFPRAVKVVRHQVDEVEVSVELGIYQ